MTLQGRKFTWADNNVILIIVNRVLKDVYGVASDKVASILKQIGYAVNDVGRLRDFISGGI